MNTDEHRKSRAAGPEANNEERRTNDASLPRRSFLRAACALGGCAVAAGLLRPRAGLAQEVDAATPPPEPELHQAEFFEKLGDNKIRCLLCPRHCEVADRERGTCGVRENHGGEYKTLVWGRCCSEHVDPIEKKPLFHYRPGTEAYSLAAPGCNIECLFCQNWEVSQFRPEQIDTWERTPADIAALCKSQSIPTVALTYSEPVVWWEYGHDIAVAAKEQGVGTVVVSNGFIEEKPLRQWLDVVSAIKVDFKAFTQRFYRDQCSGDLGPVLDTIGKIKDAGKWLELVQLVVPTLNDDETETRAMARWVNQRLGPDVPIHFTRFHPMYKLTNLEPTPVATLERCRDIALAEGLHFVYLGNVPRHPGENTYCPRSGEVVIERAGYTIIENRLVDGKCPCCNEPIPGVWG
jgi:pyruvate formate lyase activating enzyme